MKRCHVLLETTDSSLRLLSLVSLYTAIYLRGDIFDTGQKILMPAKGSVEPAQTLIKGWFQHPVMSRSTQRETVFYRCPIAKVLASKLLISPEKLVRQMADSVILTTEISTSLRSDLLTKLRIDPLVQSLQFNTVGVDIDVTENGWLEFGFDDRALQIWLMHYGRRPPLPLPLVVCSQAQQISIEIWHCWHCYERCSSLLAQAGDWQSWPLKPEDAQLPLEEPLRALLLDCLSIVELLEENVSNPQALIYLGLGAQVSQIFQKLTRQYSSCYILRESTSALGLVILIQRLLRSLLQAGLCHGIVKDLG